MTHLTMDSLLALRDRVTEPGTAAAKEHLDACPQCQAELNRLHQRIAQLKALPTLRPARDGWPAVSAKVRADRWRRRSLQGAGLVGLAMAASLMITVVTNRNDSPAPMVATVPAEEAEQIHEAQVRSRQLQDALKTYNPEARVLDGQTAGVARELNDRIAEVDQAIAVAEQAEKVGSEANVLHLWRERVGLLEGLVNVHVNGASRVEF